MAVSSDAVAGGGDASIVERATRRFFRSFLTLVPASIALTQWACVAWIAHSAEIALPLWLHVVAPLALFFVNERIMYREVAVGPLGTRVIRSYAALAFTSFFCALFLVVAHVLWLFAALVVEPLTGLFSPVPSGMWAIGVYTGFATIGGLFLLGYTLGQRALIVTRLPLAVNGLPPDLSGFRIVQVSDLHIGQYLDVDELEDHVRQVNELAPDLVCITGDLVDSREGCARAFPVLARLRARHGVVVVLGNHDVVAGAEVVTAMLRRLTPFTVLRNATMRIASEDGRGLTIIGIDDLGRDWARGVTEHPALEPLASAVSDAEPFVVLSHRPDCFPQAARLGAAAMLSGHTHGGQVGLPAWPGGRALNLARLFTAFDRGVFRSGDATLYVNRGLGFAFERVRLFTPREIACLELHPTAR